MPSRRPSLTRSQLEELRGHGPWPHRYLIAAAPTLLDQCIAQAEEIETLTDPRIAAAIPAFVDDPVAHRLGFHNPDCPGEHTGRHKVLAAFDAMSADLDTANAVARRLRSPWPQPRSPTWLD